MTENEMLISLQSHQMIILQDKARKWCEEYNKDIDLYGTESLESIFDYAVVLSVCDDIEKLFEGYKLICKKNYDGKYYKIIYMDTTYNTQIGLSVRVKL